MNNVLAPIERASRMLAEAKTLDEILQIENLAQRARDYARAAGMSLEAQNHAAKICLDARRRAGDTLVAMKASGELDLGCGGDRKSQSQPATVKLADLGLTRSQSSRYQLEASVPQTEHARWAQAVLEHSDSVLTPTGLRKLAKANAAKATIPMPQDDSPTPEVVATLSELISMGSQFACIYADPPWQYGNQSTRAATNNHYDTMTVQQICAEPVSHLTTDLAHLYLWTTAGFLREAFSVIDAWGFTYKTNMVWVKPQMGIGNYVRLSHEHLLIGIKGKTRTRGSNQKSWVEADRIGHSRKPDAFRTIIEQMSDGPYLEMYGRQRVAGWTIYGNQIEPKLFA